MILICFLYILCVPWVRVWCTCVCIHAHKGVAHIHVCGWRAEVEFLSSLIFWYTEARFLTWPKRCPWDISSALGFRFRMQPDTHCTVTAVQLWPCKTKFTGLVLQWLCDLLWILCLLFLVLRGCVVTHIIYVGVKDALWCLYNSEVPDCIVLRVYPSL